MELPQADGKLIRAGRIENMKILFSILERCARSAPKAFGALARRRLSRSINRGAMRRPSVHVTLPMLTVFATAFFIAPATVQARDVIHKGDVVVVTLGS